MRVLPSGDRALLAEYDSLAATMAAYRALTQSAPAGVVELVPAARTVLVRLEPRALSLATATRWVEAVGAAGADGALPGGEAAPVEIEVRYDGPDLADAADSLGMTPAELIGRHSGTAWRTAFIGFAPGFAYLVGEGWDREVARRATSRARVPAGAVGLAGEFSGVYPRASPGGWQLIGTTEAVLWDERRDPPALLPPGTAVAFRVVP